MIVLLVGLQAAAIALFARSVHVPGPLPQRAAPASGAPSNRGLLVQDPDHPCGPVCVALVSHLLQRPVTLEEAGEAVRPDALGRTSMGELVEALRGFGFGAAGVRLDPEACRLLEVPLIIHLHDSHFAVIVPNRADQVLLLDPPQPAVYRSLDSLEETWNGTGVLVTGKPQELEAVLGRLEIEPAGSSEKPGESGAAL